MIDWRLVGFSALWIIGLSVILTALSFGDYTAGTRQLRVRQVLGWPTYQTAINGGLALFCLGLLGVTHPWWAQVFWALLALAFAYQSWAAWRRRAGPGG